MLLISHSAENKPIFPKRIQLLVFVLDIELCNFLPGSNNYFSRKYLKSKVNGYKVVCCYFNPHKSGQSDYSTLICSTIPIYINDKFLIFAPLHIDKLFLL